MIMMSTPSSSFHDYLTVDNFLPKVESLSPIQINEDHSSESFENNSNNNKNRNNKNSTVKRPMNAFLLWARGERKRVSSDGYGVSQTSLSKFLGETWRQMTAEEKQPFLDMAETLKKQHHIDHPAYRFKPKQCSLTANKTIVKKQHSPILQQNLSTMHSSSLFTLISQQQQVASTSNATPHPIQPTVLAMCQAIIPTTSASSNNNNEWFLKLIGQSQPVIVAPPPRTQTSPITSRRAIRIQIINKHDDIPLPAPALLPMTPSPSSIAIDDTTPTLLDYLTNTSHQFNIPNSQQVLAPVIDDTNGFETLQNSSNNHLMDLDQPYNGSGWIDTPLSPLSSFDTNAVELLSTSPYSTYDFLCL